jgi:WD repeat-containing protein mio
MPIHHPVDETHYLISGTLAALTPQNFGSGSVIKSNPDLRQHCERLILRLHDPYLRAMLTHLTTNDWSEVLDEDSIPLRERLAIALQFLDDKSMSFFLRRTAETASNRGDISGIIVTGLTTAGIEILQSYIDVTGDVQTAVFLSCFHSASAAAGASKPGGKDDGKKVIIERWVETYQNLLDGWKMFRHRCQFDIERGTLVQDAMRDGDIPYTEWIPRQIMIRCNFCNKNVDVANSKTRGVSVPHLSLQYLL